MEDPKQTELKFPTDYTLLPEVGTDPIFHKAVEAVHCYPVNADMDVTTLRVMNALIVHAQTLFRHMTDEQRSQIKDENIRATPIFKIKVSKIREMIGQKSNDYERIYNALDSLFEWVFVYNVMADDKGESVIVAKGKARFIADLGKGEPAGLLAGEVTYEIPHNILRMLLEPFPHAQIEIKAVNSLRSSNAAKLYENCARYIGTTNKVTAVLPVQEWTNLIAGDGKYPGKYKDFNRYVLRPAIELLASNPAVPFTVEVIEKYGPRKKVLSLQFKLTMKNQAAFPFDSPPPTWDKRLIEILRTVYGMSMPDMVALGQMATEDEIQEALRREGEMMKRKLAGNEPIKDRGKYLKGILKNMQLGKPKYAEPEPDAEELESKALLEARSKAQQLRREFDNHQLATIKRKLNALNQAELEEVHTAFAEAKKDDVTVMSMLAKGWGAGLNSMLASWVRSNPLMVERFLSRADEVDFEIWQQLHSKSNLLTTTPS